MIARGIIVVVAAALLAVQVVRNAAVGLYAEQRPAMAAQLWASHPATEISLAMTSIAEAARDRRAVPQAAFSLMDDALIKAPLAPEPFLVRGVRAQLAGNGAKAQQAFESAQWRDPRSLPAAYFLADRYLLTNNVDRGLAEIAALARLAPHGQAVIGAYLASYARDPANWPAVRRLFRQDPPLGESALATLAGSMQTVPAVFALADLGEKPEQAQWLAPLLKTLVDAGQYAKAREVWAQSAGVGSAALIYDAAFRDKAAPAPFNWTLTSSAVGLAERQQGGKLHVLFYGQEDGILASELLLLRPGTYRLSMQLLGDPARAKTLTWSLWCDKAVAPVSSVTLDAAARGWRFEVPPGCGGQWLRLSGSSADIPQQIDVTIAALRLEKVAAGA
jgi:hypothetical protein